MPRKYPLATNQVYHIFSRSIADFKIFNNERDYQRMLMLLYYFKVENPPDKFSYFIRHKQTNNLGFFSFFDLSTKNQQKIIQLIGYCLMPTHIHLIVRQIIDQGISKYSKNVLDSYTRYFNICHKRKGPLWEGRFQNVLVKNDEQLLHLSRYIHLNPVTALLVKKPEGWQFSSYEEYLNNKKQPKFCYYKDLLKITPRRYQKFVKNRANYQKELAKIKKLSIDNR